MLDLLVRIGAFSIEDSEDLTAVNKKLKTFMKFVVSLLTIISVTTFFAIIVPIFGSENKLFFNIGFCLDWKNNDIAFYLASAFLTTEATMTIIGMLFSTLIWYLLMTCTLRYEVLGSQIRDIGVIKANEATTNKRKVSNAEKQKIFFRDSIATIESHQHQPSSDLIQSSILTFFHFRLDWCNNYIRFAIMYSLSKLLPVVFVFADIVWHL